MLGGVDLQVTGISGGDSQWTSTGDVANESDVEGVNDILRRSENTSNITAYGGVEEKYLHLD